MEAQAVSDAPASTAITLSSNQPDDKNHSQSKDDDDKKRTGEFSFLFHAHTHLQIDYYCITMKLIKCTKLLFLCIFRKPFCYVCVFTFEVDERKRRLYPMFVT